MASAIIHIAIAKELLKEYSVDNEKDYFLGSIAPDIAKQIGIPRYESHFETDKKDSPNIELFKNRYPLFQYNSFELGYYIHLMSDKIWFEKFLPNIVENSSIKLLDGTILKLDEEQINDMIYSDYTNINVDVIEEYNLDLSLFYEEFTPPKTNIKEIPVDKLDMLINKMGIIIENSKKEKSYIFDMLSINNYIKEAVDTIKKDLNEY